MLKRGGKFILVMLLCAAGWGCSPRYKDGVALEEQGRYAQAAEKYKVFALENPTDPDAPKALQSAADLYAVKLGVCREAKPLLELLVREYPQHKLPGDIYRRIFVCPDYFPVGPGLKWTYGDSQTLGRNARQIVQVTDHTSKGAVVKSSFYAGTTLVSSQKRTYRFSDADFVETQAGHAARILSYPLEAGKAWASSGPEGRLEFLVEGTGLKVKVKGGEFYGCVKVRRRVAGMPSWIYEYYAPWTGKVLTAVGGQGFENRVTELLKYEEKK
ncbi:MAG: tetratricopeptide repeat protein [Elusimicrobiales bacterium]